MGMRSHSEVWPEGFRECTKCLLIKQFTEFHKHKRCKGGYNSVCKPCRLPVSKANYESNSQEYNIWHRAKSRATKEDVPFDLEISDIVIPAICPVFGVEFVKGDTHLTPSIDRLNPTLGYVKGNVFIICNRANRLKNDATLTELLKIVSYIESCNKIMEETC